MKFNVNTRVRVTLTAYGAEAYNLEHGEQIKRGWCEPKKASDVLETELWNIANIFGACMYNGARGVPFADNGIEFIAGVEQTGWLVTSPADTMMWLEGDESVANNYKAHGCTIEPCYRTQPL